MNKLKLKSLFRRTGKLLEKQPTTGEEARDMNGNSCDSLSPEADSFCLVGALYREHSKLNTLDWDAVLVEVRRYLNIKEGGLIQTWEDKRTTSNETRFAIAKKLQEYGK